MSYKEEIKKLKLDVENLQKFTIDASNIIYKLWEVAKNKPAETPKSHMLAPRELHLKTFIKPKVETEDDAQ